MLIHELTLYGHIGSICNLPKFSEANWVDSVLVDLDLSAKNIEEDPMATLEKLPNLRRLEIWDVGDGLKEMHCRPSGFPQLRELVLRVRSLEKWRIDEGAMPKLSKLSIRCANLERIPDGLMFVTTLQELKLIAIPKVFGDRIQKGVDNQEDGADFHKIRHIPSVVFSIRN